MKVKISDIDKMIKEEFQKMLEKKKLSNRLAQINEALEQMDAEDEGLNEVEAGALTKTASDTGLTPGVQPKAKFEKIGTHLKEDEDEEEVDVDMTDDTEVSDDTMGSEMDAVVEEPAMGEFEAKFAEIGRAIDAKMTAEAGIGAEPVVNMDGAADADDEFDEVEVDAPEGDAIEGGADDSDVEEVDEYREVVGGAGQEQGITAAEVKESVDEPLEGHSVVQDATADTVNDNMSKDTHVKENASTKGSVIVEGTAKKGNIFTESVDPAKQAAVLAEMQRMRKFAGLSKDEE